VGSSLFDRAAGLLSRAREGAGFGPTAGAPGEPEPTALAAIALDDDAARTWLVDHQRGDGGFGIVAGPVRNDAATSWAALALPPGEARERALDHVVANRAERSPSFELAPHDPDTRGWAWTRGTFGWVEPTAAAVLALRRLRPSATTEIGDGLAVLADRECVGGGWNYGNVVVYDVALPPFVQTTSLALVAIQGELGEQAARGVRVLRERWRAEAGGLSLATSLAALRLRDDPAASAVEAALVRELDRTALSGDVVSLAWAAVALGPGLETLRVAA
jgi:hypothetical protein